MNLPFSFPLTSTNIYGILWNPWGTSVANSVPNDILNNLDPVLQEKYGLLMPKADVFVTGYCAQGDTAAGNFALGIWNTDRGVFDELYRFTFTAAANVYAQRVFGGSGLHFPVDATNIPVVKLLGAAATIRISGDLDLICVQPGNGFGSTVPAQPSVNLPLTDDALVPLTDDASPPVPLRTD